jgi:anti-repressor protein
MNELIPVKKREDGQMSFSGRDLHDFLEVTERYNNWFERMLKYGFVENVDFTSVKSFTVVNNGAKREINDHEMTIDMAKEISMLQRNEKGKQARQYFIEVERRWNSPEMIVQRAMEIQQRKVLELEQTIKQQKPLVEFAEACMTSDKSLLVRELAKLASKQGIKTGEKRLWQKLRDWGLVFKGKNEPYQEYVERGYFEISQGVKETSKGSLTWTTMRVKPKGQAYIINKLKEELEEVAQ